MHTRTHTLALIFIRALSLSHIHLYMHALSLSFLPKIHFYLHFSSFFSPKLEGQSIPTSISFPHRSEEGAEFASSAAVDVPHYNATELQLESQPSDPFDAPIGRPFGHIPPVASPLPDNSIDSPARDVIGRPEHNDSPLDTDSLQSAPLGTEAVQQQLIGPVVDSGEGIDISSRQGLSHIVRDNRKENSSVLSSLFSTEYARKDFMHSGVQHGLHEQQQDISSAQNDLPIMLPSSTVLPSLLHPARSASPAGDSLTTLPARSNASYSISAALPTSSQDLPPVGSLAINSDSKVISTQASLHVTAAAPDPTAALHAPASAHAPPRDPLTVLAPDRSSSTQKLSPSSTAIAGLSMVEPVSSIRFSNPPPSAIPPLVPTVKDTDTSSVSQPCSSDSSYVSQRVMSGLPSGAALPDAFIRNTNDASIGNVSALPMSMSNETQFRFANVTSDSSSSPMTASALTNIPASNASAITTLSGYPAGFSMSTARSPDDNSISLNTAPIIAQRIHATAEGRVVNAKDGYRLNDTMDPHLPLSTSLRSGGDNSTSNAVGATGVSKEISAIKAEAYIGDLEHHGVSTTSVISNETFSSTMTTSSRNVKPSSNPMTVSSLEPTHSVLLMSQENGMGKKRLAERFPHSEK